MVVMGLIKLLNILVKIFFLIQIKALHHPRVDAEPNLPQLSQDRILSDNRPGQDRGRLGHLRLASLTRPMPQCGLRDFMRELAKQFALRFGCV